jgi:DNA polymerase III subunit beta
MKIVCHREGLLSACQLASAAVASKDVKPVLRNIKAIVDGDRCTLMATDLELGLRLEVRGIKVEEAGEALFPTSRLIQILRESTDEEMTIEAGLDACIVRGNTNEFDMPGEDTAAFPDVPAFAEESYHEMTAGILRDMIKRTIFSAASEGQVRFGATTGVLWELEEDKFTLVATDGRRLAMSNGQAQVQGGHSSKGQAPVVPSKAMLLLERNLSEPDEKIRISVRPNEVLMKTERAMIYSRLVEGRFPDYKKVVPQKHTHRVPLTVGPFLAAVRQAAIMTDEESKRVRFQFAKKKLTLRAQGAESGQSRVELPIEYDGKGLEINFDPKFLIDMLRVLEPDTPLVLDMTDSTAPAVFRHEPNYLYVIVPLVESATAK